MTEKIKISGSSNKSLNYEEIIPQIEALIKHEPDLIANLANISAVLKEAMDYLWVGFYLVKGNELVLGPFQGPVACTRIDFGKGVCGSAWEQAETVIVPDVNLFQGHIACSSESKSEIVVPVFQNNEVKMILDIDSDKLNNFNEIDKKNLQRITDLIEKTFKK